MHAMMRIVPLQPAQVSMSMPNTRFRRCAQRIAARRSAGARDSDLAALALPLNVCGAVAVGAFEPFVVNVRAGDAAAQAFEFLALMGASRKTNCLANGRLGTLQPLASESGKWLLPGGKRPFKYSETCRYDRQLLLRVVRCLPPRAELPRRDTARRAGVAQPLTI